MKSSYDELYREVLAGRIGRRDVLKRGLVLGLSVPAMTWLLAACADDNDDDDEETDVVDEPDEDTDEDVDEEPEEEDPEEPEETEEPDDETDEETDEEEPADDGEEEGEWSREFEGTSIRWSTSLAESERAVFDNTILPDFQEKTGIEVEFLQIEAADLVRQLEAQVQADAVEIDLIAIDNNSLAPLVANELVEDLTEFEDMIPDATIESILGVLRFDDTLYFLPYRPNVQITYYNSGMFDEYGLEVPRTWEELLEVAQTFYDEEGVGRVAVQASPEAGAGPVGVTVTEFIWQAGGDPLELNSPEAVEAFEFLQELNEYFNPQTPTAKFDTMNTYIANDSVYLGANWPFGINVIVEEGGRDDVLAYSGWAGPAGEFHVLGGEVLGVPSGSPNRDAAMVFAEYLMSRETQELLTRELAWPSVRDDAYEAVEGWQQEYFEAVLESMENAQARPNVVYWGEVQRIMADAWNEIVSGGAPVQETLDRYQEQLEQARQDEGAGEEDPGDEEEPADEEETEEEEPEETPEEDAEDTEEDDETDEEDEEDD
jgi:trehalose transport system substrate-binding protein